MAKLYDKSRAKSSTPVEPEDLKKAIQAFIAGCRSPAVLEYGEEMAPLRPGEYALEIRSGWLWIEVWCEARSLSRRIATIERYATGLLECTVQRFGGSLAKLTFLDPERPQTAHKTLVGVRQNFTEQFRRMLLRQFPGWDVRAISCGMDLQRSFSSVFPRARLTRGKQQIAAMACPTPQDEGALLTFALIWHHYVHAHGRLGSQTPLCLFLPDTAGNLTAQRLRWLKHEQCEFRVFRFNQHGSAGEVDPADLGNLERRVGSSHDDDESDSGARKFASTGPSERWLELAVRSNLLTVDASLLQTPVHGQILALAGRDRDLIDLLAVSGWGRLTILELKTSEDIHLPLQALDYWIRIRSHAQAGELAHLFPGMMLSAEAPRLLFVAPAICFHSSNAMVLSYFSREIEMERVGLSSDWEQRFKVVLRLKGAEEPICHRSAT